MMLRQLPWAWPLSVIAACAAPLPTALDPSGVNFTLSASGSETLALSGLTVVLPTRPGAYSEGAAGARTWDVVPILLAENGPAPKLSRSLSVGALGSLRTGEYRVRRPGVPGAGGGEFYAELAVPAEDGMTLHYLVDGGTMQVRSVSPLLDATLTLHASRVVLLPADASVGARAEATPADLTVIAKIGGR